MTKFPSNFSLAKESLSLLFVFVLTASLGAFAQGPSGQHNPFGHWNIPLVYSVENTGSYFRAPYFPSFDKLPIIRPLPDPFRFADGYRDTSFASWERRRNEIKAAIEKYEIGPKPDCSDCTITALYTPPAAGATNGTLSVTVMRNGKSLTINSRVWLPQGMGNGPFPVVIPMSLAFPPFFVPPVPNYGSLPANAFSGRPVATIDFFHNDVSTYTFSFSAHNNDPFYQLYPELCAGQCTGVSNSGQYAAWAWGVSRLIDGIEIATHQSVNPLPIDVKHLAVTGCSYAGKMALFAGAFDERVALTIAQENGGGGAPAWRVTDEIEAGGASEDIQRTSYEWFAGQMHQFDGVNSYKMPTDHHELMAMVAPRALLETGNTDFYWLSNRSNYISARATQRVYDTFGIGDRFGFYIDGGHPHCGTLPEESPAIAAFVDKFLLGVTTANTDVKVNPYPKLDYKRWTSWWGKWDPSFPNDWNPGDGSTVLSTIRPMLINNGDTVSGGIDLSMPGRHPDTTVSLTGGDVQTDVLCLDGTSYTLKVPLADQSYSITANDRSWLPSANPRSPSTYQGSATANSCSWGVTTRVYFSALGLSNGVGNPPASPGFSTTDPTDPLAVRFHCTADNDFLGGIWSPPTTINYTQK